MLKTMKVLFQLDFGNAFRASRFEGSELVQNYSFFLQQRIDRGFQLEWMSSDKGSFESIPSSFRNTLKIDVEVDEGTARD